MPICSGGCGKKAAYKSKDGRFYCVPDKKKCPGIEGKAKKTLAQRSYEDLKRRAKQDKRYQDQEREMIKKKDK